MKDDRKVTDLTVDEVMGIKSDLLESLSQRIIDQIDKLIEKKLETYGLDNPKESYQNQLYITELRTNQRSLKRGFWETVGGYTAFGVIASLIAWIGIKAK